MSTKAAGARMPVFRDRFNLLRGNRTQAEFAAALGMSRATVAFYCAGDRIPDALTLRDIAEKCDVSTDWLLGLSDAMSTDATVQAICNYTGLDEFGVQELHSSYEQIRMKEKKEEKMILSDEMFWDRVRSIVADGELCRFAAAVQKCENLLFESIYSLESITETELEEATDILQMEDLTKDAEKKYRDSRYEYFEINESVSAYMRPMFERYEKKREELNESKFFPHVDRIADEEVHAKCPTTKQPGLPAVEAPSDSAQTDDGKQD